MATPELSILMPIYNERGTARQAIDEVLAANGDGIWELVVVDDGSTDGTRELVRAYEGREGVRVLLHDRNRGKGAALRTALQAATGTYAAVLDADLEYSVDDIPGVVDPLRSGD